MGVPCPMVFSSFEALLVAFQRCHGQNYPVVADPAIVDDAAKGRLVPAFLRLDAIGTYRVHHNVSGSVIAIAASLSCS